MKGLPCGSFSFLIKCFPYIKKKTVNKCSFMSVFFMTIMLSIMSFLSAVSLTSFIFFLASFLFHRGAVLPMGLISVVSVSVSVRRGGSATLPSSVRGLAPEAPPGGGLGLGFV